MKNLTIDPALFINNRKRLSARLMPNSIVILHSNDHLPTNADGHMAYKQNTDLYYLTGILQEESILILYPDAPQESMKEILFLRETNEQIAIWEGHKLNRDQGEAVSGISNIQWASQFENILNGLIYEAENIYLFTNEHVRASVEIESKNDRFIKWCKNKYPLHNYHRLAPELQALRVIKSAIEIDLLKQACALTKDAFIRVLKFTRPGVWEYQIEAEFAHEFTSQGYTYADYGPIIASGNDSCVLHYHDNNKECNDGDIILMDVGGAVGNYNADMTRVIPVNGKFTPRQKDVYNAVLFIMKEATKLLVAGNTFEKYNKSVGKIVEQQLIELGLLSKEAVAKQNELAPLYKKYFMHGISHFLGLDVHDVGSRFKQFEAGMVLTCEPGIYIPNESIGIRLENNILITANGPVDLMANIPLEADEIEKIMAS